VGVDPTSWLVLIYRVPSEPTRYRAAIWRRLRTLGAVYLQNAAAALPATDAGERALRLLRNEIVRDMGGIAVLLRSQALAGDDVISAAINAARDDEYEEIKDKCRDFLAGLEKEIVADHFTFGELEENEEDLSKLQRWFAKVRDRDLLQASGRTSTEAALAECADALESYAAQVFRAEND
jgi:ChrB-like protein